MATETKYFSKNDLRARPDHLAYRQALPDTTSEDGNGAGLLIGKTQGALEVVVRVYEDIGLTGDLTVKLQEADTETGSYTDITGATFTITNPAVGTTGKAPVELVRFALNRNVKAYVKAVITTTATPSAAGALNIYPAYFSR